MKPFSLFALAFLFSVALAGCSNKPDYGKACAEANGTWLAGYGECEFISKQACEELGGEFFECGSACRHDPDAQACILMCVPYCQFPE